MMGGAQRVQHLTPGEQKRILTIRVRIQVAIPTGHPEAAVDVADLLLQAGSIATGWVPHVTEMPWTAGVVGP